MSLIILCLILFVIADAISAPTWVFVLVAIMTGMTVVNICIITFGSREEEGNEEEKGGKKK